MGSPDPRSYSRNKRGVAGSLIWVNFDRHALLDVFYKTSGKFLANKDDIRPQFSALTTAPMSQEAIFISSLIPLQTRSCCLEENKNPHARAAGRTAMASSGGDRQHDWQHHLWAG